MAQNFWMPHGLGQFLAMSFLVAIVAHYCKSQVVQPQVWSISMGCGPDAGMGWGCWSSCGVNDVNGVHGGFGLHPPLRAWYSHR